jgi:hypothetical protein
VTERDPAALANAVEDFRRARFRAKIEQVLALFSGESTELLRYEDVRKGLRATNAVPRGLRDVPLDAIVGSVGRYNDFTRSLMPPRQDDDAARWARVRAAMEATGLPPIEVYQIGTAYFVLDSDHRVPAAR